MADTGALLDSVGEAIRAVRTERGISQEQLSLSTDVHRNYIGGIERGEREPTVSVIARLADGLGCTTSRIFQDAERLMDEAGASRT